MPTADGDDAQVVGVEIVESGPGAIEITERGSFGDFETMFYVPPGTHPVALAITLMHNLPVDSALVGDGAELVFQCRDRVARKVAPVVRLVPRTAGPAGGVTGGSPAGR